MMSPAATTALHSGIVTSRFVATCEFYFELFGFSPVEITAEYALLGRSDGSRLAVLQAGGEGQPAALSQPTRGSGLWLTFESDDVEAMHARFVACGVEVVAEPEFTASGEQRCVARDPNGVLLYITRRRAIPRESQPEQAIHLHKHQYHEDHRYRLRWISCH